MYTEHLRIPVGAGSLHIERTGRGGPAVVLLHGFGTCAFLWRQVAPNLADAGFTVLAIDLLGHGESDRPADVSISLMAQAEYVDRALSALRIPRGIVVGQDIGGLVGVLLAAARPLLVPQLLLLHPPDPLDLPGDAIRTIQRGSAMAALSAHALFGAKPLLEPFLRQAVSLPERMPDILVGRYLAPYVGSDGAAHLLQLASAVSLSEADLIRFRDVRTDIRLARAVDELSDRSTAEDQVALSRWRSLCPLASVEFLALGSAALLPAEDAPASLCSSLLRLFEDFSPR